MTIKEQSEIPEMYMLRNKHNSEYNDAGYDYTDNIIKNAVSPVLLRNDEVETFLQYINKMVCVMFDSSLPTRNIFYYTLDKYFNKHGR